MVRNIIIAVLAIVLIGTGYWGYQEHRDKTTMMINAENNYQQAYHDLTYNIDKIHDHLGTSLAANSQKSINPELTEVWRLSSLARGQIGQLPVTFLPFNKTSEFLSHLGTFSYQASVKNDGQKPLTDKQYKKLERLYKESREVEDDLRKVQDTVMNKRLHWMDVKTALAAKKQPHDNQIIDGLEKVNKKVDGFDNHWDPAVTRSSADDLRKLNRLRGKNITASQAAKIAKRFLNQPNANAKVVALGNGATYNAFNVTLKDGQDVHSALASITKKGGRMIWFVKNRDVNAQHLSLYQAKAKADRFLSQRKMTHLELVKSDQYDNIGVLTYVRKLGDIRDYPSSIRLKVALDNGEIMAFDDAAYLVHHNVNSRHLVPKLTADEALKGINNIIKVEETHLAIYENEMGKNVLCYEFIGTKNHDTYRLFINANTGRQEKAELLTV
ncbi:germination protein YpeB [Camelliibacillus cellulosilyticus]|uniref:Germination protein YpeB n=1 Tax=Camelliibacillus cellulosilyticus TaxID=2174486 RepID=A0ABV9GJS8_9BACL